MAEGDKGLADAKSAGPAIPWMRVVLPLAIAETIVWAGLYYSFPALLPHWEMELGWSKADLVFAFTLALVASALTAPLCGRIIDRGQGRALMIWTALIGALLLLALSQVKALWLFTLLWTLIGINLAGCLYEPCFAYLTKLLGARAKQAITLVTLVAGFAGTLAFPLGHTVASSWGWRSALIVFALLVIFVVVPLFIYATAHAREFQRQEAEDETMAEPRSFKPQGDQGAAPGLLKRPGFWFLAFAFAAFGFNHGTIITHLLLLLDERGMAAETAVLAVSMIGPMQVAGRLALLAFDRFLSMASITLLTFVLMIFALAMLYGSAWLPALLVLFVVLQGSAVGMNSITKPVIIAEILGREAFGVISGSIALPTTLAFAVAPTVGAIIWSFGGYDAVLGFLALITILGLLAIVLAIAFAPRESS